MLDQGSVGVLLKQYLIRLTLVTGHCDGNSPTALRSAQGYRFSLPKWLSRKLRMAAYHVIFTGRLRSDHDQCDWAFILSLTMMLTRLDVPWVLATDRIRKHFSFGVGQAC